MKRILFSALAVFACICANAAAADTLRILAIGNSFSEDAVEQNLYELARADGNCAIIGNLYIGGCPLSRHLENVKGDKPAYRYRHIDKDGVLTTTKDFRLSAALREEDWDVVTLQQSSPKSGKCASYEPYMSELISYLRQELGENVKIMFHQTWAYAKDATHYAFPDYNCDPVLMYDSIMVASRKICEKYAMEVIPSGTAIQNARSTRLRDNLYRDGYHLSHACGRYTAACTWYEAIFKRSVNGLLYKAPHMTFEQAVICQQAAMYAVANPYSVTKFGYNKPVGMYEESKVPAYTLPDPLLCENGRRVKNSKQWEKYRRDELLEIFTKEVYGSAPDEVKYMEFEVEQVKADAFNGLATRKLVNIYLDKKKKVKIELLVYTPNSVSQAPLFLGINFFGNHTVTTETDIPLPDRDDLNRYGVHQKCERGEYAYRWPVEDILRAGFGLATFYRADADPDYDDSFTKGVQYLYPNELGKACGPEQWGSLAAWAWGLSRAMDYLCTDTNVDSSKVALIGFSRLAKAALWAGACDTRFAMVAANEAGCGGAAISRRCYGETVGIINRSFPHWFCDNFKKYSENEAALPVDQHELLALIAPRLLCIGSAKNDKWSDPKGEKESYDAAKTVYDLYDAGDRMNYHIREGKHELLREDWQHYLDFASRYLK